MAKADDKQMAVGQIYSRAMHELAKSRGEADELAEELKELAKLAETHEDFATLFRSPLVDAETRAKSIERLFRGRASDLLVDSLQVINRKERMGIIDAVAEAYHLRHEDHLGQVDVYVSTAVPLSDALRARLTTVLERHTGRQPQLIETVDESLIGGIVLRIEDEKIDGSVIHEIGRLRHAMRERSEQEIHRARRAAAEAAS